MEFNPVAYRMTQRKSERSVSQFLDEHPEVSEMWELVLRADAFNRHRTIGARHYPGFIDTAQLLAKEAIREDLVTRLSERAVVRAGTVPTAVLVPNRQTARLLGGSLVEQLQATHKAGDVALTVVRRKPGSPLVLQSGIGERLRGRDVIVVDAATAYGDTLDDLSLLASQAGARLVTAAVLVSRLTEPGEAALDARLSGGFVRLFAFAVRPIRSSCADCQRLEDLRRAAGRLSAGPARDLAIRLAKRPRRFAAPSIETVHARQLELFSDQPAAGQHRRILTWCPPRIAAAVTSNAVHAARGDGMAPLSIPEIFDLEIPTENKVAMLEAIPRHSLVWNGEPLCSQLFDYLDRGREPDVWLAIAGVLAREGRTDWIERLSGVLGRSASWLSPEFWLRTQIVALELAQSGPRAAVEGEACIRDVMAAHPKVPALAGLEAMIETMRDAAPEAPRGMS
jgi:adenine/guanine phosphoribosyltransferase-like PRPP-binding protein